MLVLCLLAVVRTLRYTHWLKFHQVLSIVFLGLTLHCVRLMDTTDFMMSFGWLNLIITVAGSVAALILLFGGWSRRRFPDVFFPVSSSLPRPRESRFIRSRWRVSTREGSCFCPSGLATIRARSFRTFRRG